MSGKYWNGMQQNNEVLLISFGSFGGRGENFVEEGVCVRVWGGG